MSGALILLALGALLGKGPADPGWTLLDDFEGRPVEWGVEAGPPESAIVSRYRAWGGKRSLAVTLQRQSPTMVRAAWFADVSDRRLSLETRLRFRLFGNRRARKPHGGIIAVEAGGRQGGGDAHWMAPIPGEVYRAERWQMVEMPPLSAFAQPDWSVDADGRLDPTHVTRLLWVAQQEASPHETTPYTVWVDQVEATHVAPCPPFVAKVVEADPPTRVRGPLRGFVGRRRAHHPQVTFDSMEGWTVRCIGPVRAELARAREEPLFSRYAARLTYTGEGGQGRIELRPPRAVGLPRGMNAVQMWVFGNNWDWVPDPTTPQPEVMVRLVDRSGEFHRISLGRVNWKYWGILQARIPALARGPSRTVWGGDGNGALDQPARLAAIELRNAGSPEPRILYLDSLAFYRDAMPRVTFRPRPCRLPFPTRAGTILPSTLSPVTNAVVRMGSTWRLSASGPGGSTVWQYTPATGTLGDLVCRVGGRTFRPADGAGPEWMAGGERLGPTDGRIVRRLMSVRRLPRGVSTRWRWTRSGRSVTFDLDLEARGRSIVHTWRSSSRALPALHLGRATGLSAGRLFRVPYYTLMGHGGAGIAYDGGLFMSHLVDWYVTDASALQGVVSDASPSAITYAGVAHYHPDTAGRRNPLRERCVLTVSPRFEEVLPNIPNPPTPEADVLRRFMYTHLGGISPDRFERWLEQLRVYRKHGIDRLIVTQHEDCWTEGGDVGQGPQEYTMTTAGPPDAGGDAGIARYYQAVRALGYRVGPYNNYCDFSPLGRSWREDWVTQLPDGSWQRAWPPTYSIKPLKAVEVAERYGPAQVRKYGVDATYCDVHTAVVPWGYVDYQAGTPGAAKLRTTFESYGRILQLQRKVYGGPCFSEGTHHAFYSGLIDGSYGQMGLPDAPNQPLLLDFDLRKLHTLSADISMTPAADWGPGTEYPCMAATIAYGHGGFFPFDAVPRAARYYFLIGTMQQQYLLTPVRDIGYWDGSAFLGVSRALPAGAHRRGQVRVRYANGLEVFVNYSRSDAWRVRSRGREIELAPDSWAAARGDGFRQYCTVVDGRRVSWARTPELTFADAGGRWHDFGPIATDGEVVLKREGPTGRRLSVLDRTTRVALDEPVARAKAADGAGRPIGEVDVQRHPGGRVELAVPPAALWIDLE